MDNNNFHASGEPNPWARNASLVLAATVITQLAYPIHIALEKSYDLSSVILSSIAFLLVLTLPSLWVGFKLGRYIGIGFVNSHDKSVPSLTKGLAFAFWTGILLGTFLLLLRWALEPYLPSEIPEYGFRGALGGFLVTIGAAVAEEVWFRFGLMTLLLVGAKKLSATNQLSNLTVIVVIVLVGLPFGLAHLPQLMSFDAGTPFAIYATVLGNVVVSILYGWCYWRYGLLSAIGAHFSVNLVLHVLSAFL